MKTASRDLTEAERSVMEKLVRSSVTGQKSSLVAVLVEALSDLYEISGEANIPMANSRSVRKMSKFLAARDKAKAALEQARQA